MRGWECWLRWGGCYGCGGLVCAGERVRGGGFVPPWGAGACGSGLVVADLGGGACPSPGGSAPRLTTGAVAWVSPWVTSPLVPGSVAPWGACISCGSSRGVPTLCGCCSGRCTLVRLFVRLPDTPGPAAWQAQHLAVVLTTGEKGLVLPGHPSVLLLAQLAWLLSRPGSWPTSSSFCLGAALPVEDVSAASRQQGGLSLLTFAAAYQK